MEEQEVRERIRKKSAEYFLLWGMPNCARNVTIDFSGRLRSTLGRTRVNSRNVQLNKLLASTESHLLDEVLCHELAHIAVYDRFGGNVKPHGPEWAAYMRQAGYEPRLRVNIGSESSSKSMGRYEHLCPVCQLVRYAKRPMTRWRCESCINAGLKGKLLIRSLDKE